MNTLRYVGNWPRTLTHSKKATLKYSFKRHRKAIGRADHWWLIVNIWSLTKSAAHWLPQTYMVLTISVFNKKGSGHYTLKRGMNRLICWRKRRTRFDCLSKCAIRCMDSYFHSDYKEGQGQVYRFYWRNLRNKITPQRYLWPKTYSHMRAPLSTA